MNSLQLLSFLLIFNTPAWAQDTLSIVARVIFIGDAGEIDQEQSGVISHAAGQIISGKTTVVYLGDNHSA